MPILDPQSETQATQWSLISRARSDSPEAFEALELLAQKYRDPIRDYIRALGRHDEAEDLTQEFFARKMLRESFLQSVHRGKGSFRVFLKLCVKRFLIDHHRRRRLPGEGEGAVSIDADVNPDGSERTLALDSLEPAADRAMDQAWARVVIERARERLETEFKRAGKVELGREFLREVEEDPEAVPHREIGERCGLSAGAVRTSFYRFRLRFQHLILEELSASVSDAADLEEEKRVLQDAFSRGTTSMLPKAG